MTFVQLVDGSVVRRKLGTEIQGGRLALALWALPPKTQNGQILGHFWFGMNGISASPVETFSKNQNIRRESRSRDQQPGQERVRASAREM